MNDASKPVLLVALLLGLGASSASAGVEAGLAPSDAETHGVGDPSMRVVSTRLSEGHGLPIPASWRIYVAQGDRLTIAPDHLNQLVVIEPSLLVAQPAPYIGVGGTVSVGDDVTTVGPRNPDGLSRLLADASFELGVEIAPGLTVLPATGSLIDRGLRARYCF